MNDALIPGSQIESVVIPQDQNKAEQVANIILEAARADVGLLRTEMTGIRNATIGIQAELTLLANKADVLRVHTHLQARIERVACCRHRNSGRAGAASWRSRRRSRA